MIRPRKVSEPKYDYQHQLLFKRVQKVRDDFEYNKKKIKQMWRER